MRTQEVLTYSFEGERIEIPLVTFTGAEDGPTAVITAGIHGGEYPAIEAALRLSQTLEAFVKRGRVKLVTISSVKAFEERSAFVVPVDGKNLNRLFPGTLEGTYSDALAYHIFHDIVEGADLLLDLHGGDMVEDLEPFTLYHDGEDRQVTERSRHLAAVYGIPNVLPTTDMTNWPDTGANYANAAKHGIPSIIAEAGRTGLLTEDAVEYHVEGVLNVLRDVKILEGSVAEDKRIEYFQEFGYVRAPRQGFCRLLVKVGDEIKDGQLLGTVTDYFGKEIEQITSPVAGRVLLTTSSPAVRAGGITVGIGKRNE